MEGVINISYSFRNKKVRMKVWKDMLKNKIIGGRLLRLIVMCLATVVSVPDAFGTGDAVFHWFEYCGGREQPAKHGGRGKRVAAVQPTTCVTDSFATAELDERWIHLNEPDDGNYRPGMFGLQLTPTYYNLTHMDFSPTAIFMEPDNETFRATCSVSYTPSASYEFAGMALYGDAGNTIVFGRSMVNGHQAVVVRHRHDGKIEKAYQPLQKHEWGAPVWLRVKVGYGECSFFYSTNRGVTWIPVANNLPVPGYKPDTDKDDGESPMMVGLYTTTNVR